MTLERFNGMVEEMSIILNMESGGEEKQDLSGRTGFNALKAVIPRGHKR